MPVLPNDRNLLFGLLALQTGLIRRDAFVAAVNAWTHDKTKTIEQLLVESKALTAPTQALVAALVQRHLEAHENDVEKSLASLSSLGSLREILASIEDAELQATVAHIPMDRPGDVETPLHTAGVSTSKGTRFRIVRPHAKGGLGVVFVAQDQELQRDVALKEIQERYADDQESRTRFMLEAEITGGLEHPGIVPVYGLGQYADGRPFYAMRFIRGDSLRDAIVKLHADPRPWRDKSFELRELLERFIDVCNAIQYAHDRGILHRDLKPGNIMLGKYGETLVVDWGLAKILGASDHGTPNLSEEPRLQPSSASGSEATLQGSAVGTPQYMSPEQAAGRLNDLGPTSDVYSLGATLYSLLTGKAPFDTVRDAGGHADLAGLLGNVQAGAFTSPRRHNPHLSPPLEAICLKAMALKPDDRYVTPRALIDDVKHWLADEPVSAWPEPWTVKARRWTSRHRTLVTGLAAAILVGTISLLVATVLLADRNAVIAQQYEDLHDAHVKTEKQRVIAVANHLKAEERLDQSVETLKLFAIDARAYCEDAMVPEESKQKLFDVLLRQLETQAEAGVDREFNEDKLRARIFLYEAVAMTQIERGNLKLAEATLNKALKLADRWLVARPGDPGALGRRAAVLQLFGTVHQSLRNGKTASKYFNEALDIRKQLLGNERVERFTPAKTITDLADTFDALERWEEAVKLRRRAYDVITQRIANKTNKPDDAFFYIDVMNWTYQKAAARTADYQKRKEYLDQANATSAALYKLRKTGRVALQRWAKNLHLYGETEYRQSRQAAAAGNQAKAKAHLAEAKKQFTKYADVAKLLATSRDLLRHRQTLAQAWYELARIEKAMGAMKFAEQHWAHCLHLHDELIRDYRNAWDISSGAERLLVLAQLGRHAEATERADILHIKVVSKYGLYTLARIYAVASVAVPAKNALRATYLDKAVQCLEESIASGFDHWEAIRNEPDLAPLHNDPRFKKLLESKEK